jgi:hypothetical protein
MSMRSMLSRQTAAITFLLVGLAACSEAPSAPEAASLAGRDASWSGPPEPHVWDRTVWVCKVGSDATFGVTVDGVSTGVTHAVLDGNCEALYTQEAGVDENHMVAVTELAAAGQTLDSLKVETTRYGLIQSTTMLTGTPTATVEVTWTKGAILTYYNSSEEPPPPPPPPPPAGGEGCTPGYWKQAHHFDSWVGYTPNMLFSDVFEDAFPGKTLLDVLKLGGGGLNALGRHTVAALLNTANAGVDYDIGSPVDVINAFNAAFPGSDYTTLKDRFEGFNEQGCPLN